MPARPDRHLKAHLHSAHFQDDALLILQPRNLRAADESGTRTYRSVGPSNISGAAQIVRGAYQVYRRYPKRADPDAAETQPIMPAGSNEGSPKGSR